MNDAKKRVVEELEQLNERLAKLTRFMEENEMFFQLSEEQRFLLGMQRNAMNQYRAILLRRLSVWEKDDKEKE